jgi:hypothetical protein
MTATEILEAHALAGIMNLPVLPSTAPASSRGLKIHVRVRVSD